MLLTVIVMTSRFFVWYAITLLLVRDSLSLLICPNSFVHFKMLALFGWLFHHVFFFYCCFFLSYKLMKVTQHNNLNFSATLSHYFSQHNNLRGLGGLKCSADTNQVRGSILPSRCSILPSRKTNSNENKTNEENNVSNMEGNSNNINEERRDTPNPSRHNSYNYNHYRSRNRSDRYNSKNYYHKHYPPRQRQHLRF